MGTQRSKALQAAGIEVPSLEWRNLPGRLLVLFPDDETADGGAEGQSEGFFDVHNTPPWDTWVAYFEELDEEVHGGRRAYGYLLAYVPAIFVPRVELGIAANPEFAIKWLDDSETVIAALVKGATT
ncbi:hypothetical protein WA016_08124 [Myxococcus stipitatus]